MTSTRKKPGFVEVFIAIIVIALLRLIWTQLGLPG